jgi:hypothetical protein
MICSFPLRFLAMEAPIPVPIDTIIQCIREVPPDYGALDESRASRRFHSMLMYRFFGVTGLARRDEDAVEDC